MLYLSLRQYEYVIAVADAESVSEAALMVGVSQPSLSVAIKQVEARLGKRIFDRRRGAKVRITPFGHRFVARARQLLEDAHAVELGNESSEPFVFGCFSDIAPWRLGGTIDMLRTHLPDRKCHGVEGRFPELADGLAEGRIQLAMSYDLGFDDHIAQRTIQLVNPVAFMSVNHPFANCKTLELEDLLSDALILFAEPESEQYMNRLFAHMDLKPRVAQRVTSLELMRSLAAHGWGIGVSYTNPPTRYSYDLQELVTIPIVTKAAQAELKLVWPQDSANDSDLQLALKLLSTSAGAENPLPD